MAYEDDVLISGWDYPSDCVNRKRLSQNRISRTKNNLQIISKAASFFYFETASFLSRKGLHVYAPPFFKGCLL